MYREAKGVYGVEVGGKVGWTVNRWDVGPCFLLCCSGGMCFW